MVRKCRQLLLIAEINSWLTTCWSFNGPEPGGSESKREKEADIPWFTRKANKVLRARTAARRHWAPSRVGEGTVQLLERVLKAWARK